MSSSLDRQAPCPSCGASITFKFAGARAVVCEFCQYVIARTDRGLQATGRMGDLIEIATPLVMDAMGNWSGEQFVVHGRIQMDRAGAPGAPWQEILLHFPYKDSHTWVAYAQGKWYATNETPLPAGGVPHADTLGPGSTVDLGEHGHWVVAEIGQRRVIAGEGAMSMVPAPNVVTRYADISAAGGKFGTIDYGDGSAEPVLFIGREFDSRELVLDSGAPLEAPQAKAQACECPNCGANLPLVSQQSERVVCQYCGTASDIRQGTLSALGPSPPPPVMPQIALGSEGPIRGNHYIVCGFMIRSCMVEGVRYSWREYLLFGGEAVGYRWLAEEDGNWQFVEPMAAGDVLDSGHGVSLNNQPYSFKQSVQAVVDFVIGEFYWKVEIGEQVEATEFEGPGGKISREKSATEVNYTFMTPVGPNELAPFGVHAPMTTSASTDSAGGSTMMTIIIIIIICMVLAMVMGGGCGGGGSSYRGGGSSWSK